MRTVLATSLVAVVVLSCVWLAVHVFASLRWKPRDYRCALLTEDIVLRGQGTDTVLGTLKKGTVIFAPTREDMGVTDPGDIQLHKVYVRLRPDALNRLVLLPPRRPDARVPQTVCNVLEAVPLSASTNAATASTSLR